MIGAFPMGFVFVTSPKNVIKSVKCANIRKKAKIVIFRHLWRHTSKWRHFQILKMPSIDSFPNFLRVLPFLIAAKMPLTLPGSRGGLIDLKIFQYCATGCKVDQWALNLETFPTIYQRIRKQNKKFEIFTFLSQICMFWDHSRWKRLMLRCFLNKMV